jgi:hypothetical protein
MIDGNESSVTVTTEIAMFPNGPVPVFWSVNDNALELPTCTPPNAKGFGLTVAIPLPPPPPEVVIVVGFVPVAVADPPPDTLTEFVTEAAALLATFTVTVIAG